MNSKRVDKQEDLERAAISSAGLVTGGALGATVLAKGLEGSEFLGEANPTAAGTLAGVGAGVLGSVAANALVNQIRKSKHKHVLKRNNLAYR